MLLLPSEIQELQLREDADDAASIIDSYGPSQAPNSYAGNYIDQAAGGIIRVGFAENADDHLAELQAIYPYPDRLRVFTTSVSLDALEALRTRVDNDLQVIQDAGITLNSISTDVPTNTVQLGVTNPVASQEEWLRDRYGDRVVLVQESPSVQTDGSRFRNSRQSTKDPMYAGMRLITGGPDPSYCSSGFSIRRGADYRMLSAGHCGPRGTPWSQFADSFLNPINAINVGVTTARQLQGDLDVSLVSINRRRATSLAYTSPTESTYRRITRAAPFSEGTSIKPGRRGTTLCMVGFRKTEPRCGQMLSEDYRSR